nr:phosphatidylinositol 4-kinase [Sutcliffiella cohnii]
MNIIEIDAFLKELGDDKPGMSKPIQVIGSDGNTYILKNQNVYDPRIQKWVFWDSMFIQEVLVYNICKYLDIKVPNCVIANIDQAFIENAPALKFEHRYSVGFHFASGFIENIEDNILNGYRMLIQMGKPYIKTPWKKFFQRIHNTDDIAKIIALDLLTANFDRFGNEGNLMIAKENGKRYVYAIDHGHCFNGPSWDINKRQELLNMANPKSYVQKVLSDLHTYSGAPLSGLGVMFKALDQHIDVSNPSDHSFMDVVKKIENINTSIIDGWFNNIPGEWYVDKINQISFYKQYILKKKEFIRVLINQLAMNRAFESYTGGELEWRESRTGTL